MKVVLFCGGLGLRLRDHAESVPKPMVQIGYRPILWHVMNYYAHYGHKDFILCLGYRADLIKQYFLNYNECVLNDFVLTNGGKELQLLKSDIQDWNIDAVDTPEQFWDQVCSAIGPFGFSSVSLQVGGERYEYCIRAAEPDDCWRVRIEARSSDYLELACEIHCPTQPLLTTAFVDLLGSFRTKFGSFERAAIPAAAGR